MTENKNSSLIIKNKFALIPIVMFFLLLITALGFWLRMVPAEIRPQQGYSFDRAFHFRMTLEAVTHGSVPDIDRLSLYPEGKDITGQLPVFMYYAAALYHKFINLFGEFDISTSCDTFSALMGAAIGIPVFFISLSFSGNIFAALVAALIAVIIPAHFRRTFCFWFKYEGIGTLLFLCSFQFFISAIIAEKKRINTIFSVLCALTFVLMLATWRLAIFIYVLYFLFAFILLVTYKFNRNTYMAFCSLFIFTAISTQFIKYLDVNSFISSNIMIVSFTILVAAFLSNEIKDRYLLSKSVQKFLPIMIFMLTTVPLLLFTQPTIYQNFTSLFFARLLGLFGKHVEVFGINKVLLFTQELRVIRPTELFSVEIYSCVFFFIFLLPFSLRIQKASSSEPIFTKGRSIVYMFFAILFLSSILFFRNKVLAAPFFAFIALDCIMPPINNLKQQRFEPKNYFIIFVLIFSGALLGITLVKLFIAAIMSNMLDTGGNLFSIMIYMSQTLSTYDMALSFYYLLLMTVLFLTSLVLFMRFYSEHKNPFTLFSVFILMCSVFFIFKTADDAVFMAVRTANRFAPSKKVIQWVRNNIPVGTPILSYWGQGYTTQLYTGCPTLFDGFLENEKIRKRILDFESSFCLEDENVLYNLCRSHYTEYIIMPTFKSFAIAQTAGIDYNTLMDYSNKNQPIPTAKAMQTVLFKMIYRPEQLSKFKLIFTHHDQGEGHSYRIFKLK